MSTRDLPSTWIGLWTIWTLKKTIFSRKFRTEKRTLIFSAFLLSFTLLLVSIRLRASTLRGSSIFCREKKRKSSIVNEKRIFSYDRRFFVRTQQILAKPSIDTRFPFDLNRFMNDLNIGKRFRKEKFLFSRDFTFWIVDFGRIEARRRWSIRLRPMIFTGLSKIWENKTIFHWGTGSIFFWTNFDCATRSSLRNVWPTVDFWLSDDSHRFVDDLNIEAFSS